MSRPRELEHALFRRPVGAALERAFRDIALDLKRFRLSK